MLEIFKFKRIPSLSNGRITSRSDGKSNAGNINLNVTGNLRSSGGTISATSTQLEGGDINIAADDIRLSNSSLISTSVKTLEPGESDRNHSTATDAHSTSSQPQQLVEAQGWVINEKEQVVMTAQAPTKSVRLWPQ